MKREETLCSTENTIFIAVYSLKHCSVTVDKKAAKYISRAVLVFCLPFKFLGPVKCQQHNFSFSRESGTNSLYQQWPVSLKNLATPVRDDHFPPAARVHLQSEPRGPDDTLQAQEKAPKWRKVKASSLLLCQGIDDVLYWLFWPLL